MKKLQLAVISDIHVGPGARAKDLCPPATAEWKNKFDDGYVKKFQSFIKHMKIRADYLILPGDATDQAQPLEVELASKVILEVAQTLGVPEEHIIFVPGNHDVDWTTLSTPDPTGIRLGQRYECINHGKYTFNAITKRGRGSLFESPYYTIWESNPDLLVVGYNSSHHDQPHQAHYGLIHPDHMELMRRDLSKFAISNDQLRLFLIHHHPIPYTDPTHDHPDLSIMINSESLLSLLREFRFDMLIHGHKHAPRFTTTSLQGGREVAILCSGSFSVDIDSRWIGCVTNQFHLVTIDERDEDEKVVKGTVESWAYTYAKGWQPSEAPHDGIAHVEQFGTYLRPGKLEAQLEPLISASLLTSPFVEWTNLAKQNPMLRHLRSEEVIRALDGLAAKMGFRRIFDAPHKIILIKEG